MIIQFSRPYRLPSAREIPPSTFRPRGVCRVKRGPRLSLKRVRKERLPQRTFLPLPPSNHRLIKYRRSRFDYIWREEGVSDECKRGEGLDS
jgi:hypothetical protein